MSDIMREIVSRMHRESHPECPHCGEEIDMTDTERGMGHVTYWAEAEDAVKGEDCPHCGHPVVIREHVTRSWTAHKSEDDAWDY